MTNFACWIGWAGEQKMSLKTTVHDNISETSYDVRGCPFCNAIPYLHFYKKNGVVCRNEKCGVNPAVFMDAPMRDVVAAWNRRAT
jgi:hypothetical protein